MKIRTVLFLTAICLTLSFTAKAQFLKNFELGATGNVAQPTSLKWSDSSIMLNYYDEMFGFDIQSTDMDGDGDLDLVFGAPSNQGTSCSATFAYSSNPIGTGRVMIAPNNADTLFDPYFTNAYYNVNTVPPDVFSDPADYFFGWMYYLSGYSENSTGLPGPIFSHKIWGPGNGDEFGSAISLGDFDGDGLGDVLVGAPCAGSGQGWAYIILGSTLANVGYENDVSQIYDFIIGGLSGFSRTGAAVSHADVDQDGLDDVMIGSPNHDFDRGAVHVILGSNLVNLLNVFGATPGTPAQIGMDITVDSDWGIYGPDYSHEFGHTVAGLGDANGDGVDDIAVGAPDADFDGGDSGAVYIFSGGADLQNPGASASLFLDAVNTAAYRYDGHNVTLATTGARLGQSLVAAGDVNGDGLGDILAGSPQYTWIDAGLNTYTSGQAYLILSSHLQAGVTSVQYAQYAFRPVSIYNADSDSGEFVAAGDLDGDGLSDLVVSDFPLSPSCWVWGSCPPVPSPPYDTPYGKVYIYRAANLPPPPAIGSASIARMPLLHADYSMMGGFGFEEYAENPKFVGDLNGDGYGDLMVAGYGGISDYGLDATIGPDDEGKAFLVYGNSPSAVYCYEDLDGDGFGGSQPYIDHDGTCDLPFVPTAWDCDESNTSIHTGAPEICSDGIDQNCDNVDDICPGYDTDDDGDGFSEMDGDCDDTNAATHPGASEICDNQDNDCDGSADEGLDGDGDGFTTCGGDCNDSNGSIYPGATETCDGIDNNCSGSVDEGYDLDGDGTTTCGGDCNDGNASMFPGNLELCGDGIDNNCNGQIDEAIDADGDGFTSCSGDCDDGKANTYPGAPELCDGEDNDCDGSIDEGLDADGDGMTSCDGDCDDMDPTVYAGAPEVNDGKDNDCDGTVDEIFDNDGDGVNELAGDCNDNDSSIYPGAPEICDGQDNDCDGLTDESPDADADGYTVCENDCDDADPAIHPGAPDTCGDGIDMDCNNLDGCYTINEITPALWDILMQRILKILDPENMSPPEEGGPEENLCNSHPLPDDPNTEEKINELCSCFSLDQDNCSVMNLICAKYGVDYPGKTVKDCADFIMKGYPQSWF